MGWSEKDQTCKLQFPQADYVPRNSLDFRTVFGIMIGPFFSCEIGKTWGTENDKKPYVKWEKARKPLSNGRKWANYLPRYHVTELISEQVSDFCFGHRKWLFWSEEKQWKWLFLTLKTGTSGARNKNLRPVLISALWRGNVVSNLLTVWMDTENGVQIFTVR